MSCHTTKIRHTCTCGSMYVPHVPCELYVVECRVLLTVQEAGAEAGVY